MKWLKSTTQKSWVVGSGDKQYIIPPCDTTDNRWLSMGDDEYMSVAKLPVIASLIKAGNITVLSEEPAELKNSVPQLQIANTQLEAELSTAKGRITELEAQLKDVNNIDIEKIKADAIAPVQKALDDKQKELEELDAKASRIIEDKDAEITELKKELKKAKKGSGE